MTKVLLPRMKGLDPDTLAKDILSVQPMTVSVGQIYTLPADLFEDTWENYLYRLWLNYSGPYCNSKEAPEFRIMTAIGEMQEKFPGEYTLEEYYDDKIQQCKYRIVFDTPEDESFFIMKYSTK